MSTTEYDRRGPNDRAEIDYRASERARLTGLPHVILSNACESWVAGPGAYGNFWADMVPAASFDDQGKRQ